MVTAPFRRVARLAKGYDVAEVDRFMRSADDDLTAGAVRLVAFTVTRHGYDVQHVDEALDRLEDEAAARERDRMVATRGPDAPLEHLSDLADSLQGRLSRARGRRFRRGRRLHHTYDPGHVDDLCDELAASLAGGTRMSVDDVRSAVFRSRRGRQGYREADVDAFLDRAAAIMLAGATVPPARRPARRRPGA